MPLLLWLSSAEVRPKVYGNDLEKIHFRIEGQKFAGF
jgi:hypothetical protein